MAKVSKKKQEEEVVQRYEISQERIEEYIVLDASLFPVLITADRAAADALVAEAKKKGGIAYVIVADRGEHEDYTQDIEVD